MREKLVIGNWKMNGSISLIDNFLDGLSQLIPADFAATALIALPACYLGHAQTKLQRLPVQLCAQDASQHLQGAYTGELSADMLLDLGCKYAIVGHSERRTYHGESDAVVAAKALAALRAGVRPVVCVGETLAQREAGDYEQVIAQQVHAVLQACDATQWAQLIIAYEPVWAIGTGKTASPAQAQEVHRFIRGLLRNSAAEISILYGGSVKPDNAEALFAQPDIDGGLVGGASLNTRDFVSIYNALYP